MAAASNAAKRLQPTVAKTPNNDRSFRPDIEGLRALAVGIVVLNHAGMPYVSGGYVGVDVFFVLSGFLITGILLREIEQSGSVSLPRFYARRARRLLPAGALVLAITVIASHMVIGGTRSERVAEDARWTALFASNYRFIQQGTDYMNSTLPPSPVQHYWSLAVEEQFYVVWPLLLIGIAVAAGRKNARISSAALLATIVVGSFAWSVYSTSLNGTAAYFSPFTRAWELGLGGLLAIGLPQIKRLSGNLVGVLGWGGLAAILFSVLMFDESTVFPGYAAAVPVLGTCLIVAAGAIAAGRGVERVLAIRPAQMLGRYSYSLYLWHWPVLIIGAAWAEREPRIRENLMLCVLAVGLSAITYHVLEQPVRDSTWLKVRRPSWSVGLGAALTLGVLLIATVSIQTRATEPVFEVASSGTMYLPNESQVLRAVAEGTSVSEWPPQPKRISNPAYSDECDVTRADTTSSMCIHGDPDAQRVIVVFGDSHAAMWIPALDIIGREQGWQVIQLTKPGCQVPDFPRYSPTMQREYTECGEYREWAIGQIENLNPDLVVISSSSRDVQTWVDGAPSGDSMDQVWADGLRTVIARISPRSGGIAILGDMAYPGEPGIDCLTSHSSDAQECTTPRDSAVPAEMNAVELQVANESGIKYVDTVPWFCTQTECPAVIGGLTTNRDGFHASENYTIWLSNVLGQELGVIPEGRDLSAIQVPDSN